MLESPALQVLSWAVQPLHGGVERGSAVYRLQGQAGAQGGTIPWSLILKVVQPLLGEMDPLGEQYYKREALAFRSGLLNRLPGKIRAPRCHAVQERPDGSIRLWLEDVRDELGKAWPLAHYGVAARQLGQWNGTYLMGEPPPPSPGSPATGCAGTACSTCQRSTLSGKTPTTPSSEGSFPAAP